MTEDKTPKAATERRHISRRSVVKGIGGAVAAAMASQVVGPAAPMQAAGRQRRGRPVGPLPDRPNILLLITDQEREPQWWPEGWANDNLPNRRLLADTGLSFNRAFCSAAMCTPSRASLFTGRYPSQHGMSFTLTEGGEVSPGEPTLRRDIVNMGSMLRTAGYDVAYRGKWHLSKGPDGGDSTPDQLEEYGFDGWSPPEAAQDTEPEHFGGGCANRDEPYAVQAADFLSQRSEADSKPFFLVASFGNPHDVLAYPQTWDEETEPGCFNYLPDFPDLFDQGIDLPGSYDEDLLTNYKPTAQVELKVALNRLGVIATAEQARNYANFYAYLHKVVDEHLGTVLSALRANVGVYRNTIVIRISDHGELGMAHGGLRQKAFNVYEESLRVPMVISNPELFPQPVRTDAFASLVDLMPTLATLADVPNRRLLDMVGQDLTPVIEDAAMNPNNPTEVVQDSVLFTFDDENASNPNELRAVQQPKNIRCIRTDRYKYAMYFDPDRAKPSQHELYDLEIDPAELNNLAHAHNPDHDPALAAQMHERLVDKMTETDTHPLRGTVAASGWFNSAAGSYTPDPAAAGPARFTFNSRNPRNRGAWGAPIGNIRFEFGPGAMDFRSDEIQSLWVAGTTAKCVGSGTIDGAGDYGFELWARTAGTLGFDSPDVLRVRIVDNTKLPIAHDYVVYDNSLPDGHDSTGNALESGRLVIRPKP